MIGEPVLHTMGLEEIKVHCWCCWCRLIGLIIRMYTTCWNVVTLVMDTANWAL